MSMRYKGGVISATPPTVSTTSAPGVWTLPQQFQYQGAGTWPLSVVPDPYFEYVTMLLHGDGTNGAQNNTFLDSSTNAFTITRNGNATQGTFSPFSRADGGFSNYFDGTGDYLSVADNAAFELGTGNFTAECFVYLSNVSSGPFVFGQWESSSGSDTNSSFLIYVSASKFVGLVAYGNSTSQVSLTGTTTLTNETWYHVALVRNGTSLTLYVNGVQEATSTTIGSSTVNNSNLSVIVGGRTGGTSLVTGYISNARIVKGTAVYTGAFTPPTTPLTAITNTSLLTCQSNRFKDNSTNAFAITFNGNPSVQVFNPFNPTTAYSTTANGGSGYFDGSGDYLTVPDDAAFDMGTGDFTLETWAYITSIPDTTGQAIFGEINNGYEWYMYSRSSGNLEVGMQTFAGGYSQIYTTNNYVKANQWAHIAVARQSGTLRIFVNGVQCTTTGSMPATLNNASTINISRSTYNNSNFVYGYLSNLRVVKGTAVYTANFTPPTAPLTAISGTSFLMSCTNAGIFDNAAMNDLETVGNAQISTSVKKFGTGSLAFDATDDRLVMAGSPNFAFGTGDFTIEFWMYSNDVSSTQRGPFQISATAGGLSTSGAAGISIIQGGNSTGGALNGGLYAYILNTVVGSNTPVLSTGTWYHIAVTRQSGTVRLFVDGNLHASGTVSGDMTGQNLVVGGYYSTSYLYNGYLDDLRITKGYARYTANFTPPTAAFPNL